jgi:CRP-like cAMP-binding protein
MASVDPGLIDGIVARLIQHVPVFRGLKQAELIDLLAHSQQVSFDANQTIFREGDVSKLMYVILRGSVEIFHYSGSSLDDSIGTLGAGHCFGEMALADSFQRSATAITRDGCSLWGFSAETILPVVNLNRSIYKNLANVVLSRCLALEGRLGPYIRPQCYERECYSHIVASTMFSINPIETPVLAGLQQLCRILEVPAGQQVVCEGGTGQTLYFVIDGDFEVTRADDSFTRKLANLNQGHCFGEVGFLNHALTRNASVKANVDSKVLRVTSAELEKSAQLEGAVYRYLAKKLSMRLRGLNRVHGQIVLGDCHSDCPDCLPGADPAVLVSSKGAPPGCRPVAPN